MIDVYPALIPVPGSQSSAHATHRLGHIYIVDDDSMVRRSLSFFLSTLGYETRPFASGRDFLDAVDALQPGCVLLDIRMPEMDGLTVLDKLGAKIDRFPVIAMTGHGDVSTAVNAMKRGVQDFLEKPFSNADLARMLETLVHSLNRYLIEDDRRNDARMRIARLTSREKEILHGIIEGLTNRVAAHKLGISIRTVEMHRKKLLLRMHVKSSAEAIQIANLAL